MMQHFGSQQFEAVTADFEPNLKAAYIQLNQHEVPKIIRDRLRDENWSVKSNEELLFGFRMIERHLDPKLSDSVEILETFDMELASRVETNSISFDDLAAILGVLSEHNILCPHGYELSLDLTLEEAKDDLFANLAAVDNYIDVVRIGVAYATCNQLRDESLDRFEEHLLTRLPIMSDDVVVYLLKAFAQADVGNKDEFYGVIERHLAPKMSAYN